MDSQSLDKIFPEAKIIDGLKYSSKEILSQITQNIQSKEGSQITLLNLPSKGSANDMEVKEWDQVILTSEWQKRAKDANIPYEMEYFIITQIKRDSENNPISYRLIGSMGGGWDNIDWNQPNVISNIISNLVM